MQALFDTVIERLESFAISIGISGFLVLLPMIAVAAWGIAIKILMSRYR